MSPVSARSSAAELGVAMTRSSGHSRSASAGPSPLLVTMANQASPSRSPAW